MWDRMCMKFISIRIIYLSPILKFIEPRRQSERVRIHTRWWILFDISFESILELPQISHKTFSRMQLHKYLCWASECEKLMEGGDVKLVTEWHSHISQSVKTWAQLRELEQTTSSVRELRMAETCILATGDTNLSDLNIETQLHITSSFYTIGKRSNLFSINLDRCFCRLIMLCCQRW